MAENFFFWRVQNTHPLPPRSPLLSPRSSLWMCRTCSLTIECVFFFYYRVQWRETAQRKIEEAMQKNMDALADDMRSLDTWLSSVRSAACDLQQVSLFLSLFPSLFLSLSFSLSLSLSLSLSPFLFLFLSLSLSLSLSRQMVGICGAQSHRTSSRREVQPHVYMRSHVYMCHAFYRREQRRLDAAPCLHAQPAP